MLAPRLSKGFNPAQPYLFPVDATVHQTMMDMYSEEAQRAETALAKLRSKGLERAGIAIKQANTQGVHWENEDRILAILENPLGRYQKSDLDVQPSNDVDLSESSEQAQWSEDAMKQLHEAVLIYSLTLLNSKGNAQEKRETLEWFWDDEAYKYLYRTIDGKQKLFRYRNDQFPFTFRTCCRLCELHFEDLRAGLAWEMRETLPKLGFAPKD
jgi:hypothetical protein